MLWVVLTVLFAVGAYAQTMAVQSKTLTSVQPTLIDYKTMIAPVDSTAKVATQSTMAVEPVKVATLNFYDGITDSDLDNAATQIAKENNEDTAVARQRIYDEKSNGTLALEVETFKNEHPVKFAAAEYYIKTRDQELYVAVQNLPKVTPDFLQRNTYRTVSSIDFGNVNIAPVKAVSYPTLQAGRTGLSVVMPQKNANDLSSSFSLMDTKGNMAAQIIVKYGADSTTNKFGDAVRNVEQARIVSFEKSTEIKTKSNDIIKVKVFIDAELNNINPDSRIDVTVESEPRADIAQSFNRYAQANGFVIVDRAGSMTVEKQGMENGKEIGSANIIFKVPKEWLAGKDKQKFRIFRNDDTGNNQILPVRYDGEDNEGYAIFVAESKDGLSTFALFMVQTIKTGEPGKFSWSSLKAAMLPIIIVIVVGGMFAGTYFYRKGDKKRK